MKNRLFLLGLILIIATSTYSQRIELNRDDIKNLKLKEIKTTGNLANRFFFIPYRITSRKIKFDKEGFWVQDEENKSDTILFSNFELNTNCVYKSDTLFMEFLDLRIDTCYIDTTFLNNNKILVEKHIIFDKTEDIYWDFIKSIKLLKLHEKKIFQNNLLIQQTVYFINDTDKICATHISKYKYFSNNLLKTQKIILINNQKAIRKKRLLGKSRYIYKYY